MSSPYNRGSFIFPHRQKPLLNHSPSEWFSVYKEGCRRYGIPRKANYAERFNAHIPRPVFTKSCGLHCRVWRTFSFHH